MNLSVESVNVVVGFISNLNRNLYLNDQKADVFFVCGGEMERIPAHKLILSEVSETFNEMFYGESADDESNAIVTLPKTSPEAFRDFLQLFYMDKVNFRLANIPEIVDLTETYRVPNQRMLYELNHVPERNSPGHILNALNDDCIQTIFRKLEIEDYMSAAKVCNRFLYNAKVGFPAEFRRLEISENTRRGVVTKLPAFQGLVMNKTISQTFAAEFLTIFGSLVHSIHCDGVLDGFWDLIDFSRLTALKSLDLCGVNISNFNLFPQLTSVKLHKSNNVDITQPFPNLVEAILIRIDLTSSQLSKFLHSNPQLRHLAITLEYTNIPPFMYDLIVQLGKNLERFTTCCTNGGYGELMQLSELRKLKAVVIHNIDIAHLNRLIDHFIRNDVKIVELSVTSTNVRDPTGIAKLKNLKRLATGRISETNLLEIVKNLPQLEQLETKNDSYTERVTPNGIIDILNMAKSLIKFSIAFHYFEVTLEEYQAILALAKHSTIVKIFTYNREIPPEALKLESKWLKIILIPEWHLYQLCGICLSFH